MRGSLEHPPVKAACLAWYFPTVVICLTSSSALQEAENASFGLAAEAVNLEQRLLSRPATGLLHKLSTLASCFLRKLIQSLPMTGHHPYLVFTMAK
ncbi:hypothetical protein IG631_22143 [Alternaria alternata]|nr:hypothetical protein IG631_22143 [Alternaria alternata]